MGVYTTIHDEAMADLIHHGPAVTLRVALRGIVTDIRNLSLDDAAPMESHLVYCEALLGILEGHPEDAE